MGRAIALVAVVGGICLGGLFLITGGTFELDNMLKTVGMVVVAVVAIVFGAGVNNMIFGSGNYIDQSRHEHNHFSDGGSGHLRMDRKSAKFLNREED